MSDSYIITLNKEDLVLFAKERWCVRNDMDPSYVYEVTNFSEGVVKLFLEDQIPPRKFLVLPYLVDYLKSRGNTLRDAVDIARKIYIGSEYEVESLWTNPARRTDRLESLREFVKNISSGPFDTIYRNIQSTFTMRDYVMSGQARTTLPVVDVYNRMIPVPDVPILYYKDPQGTVLCKTNARFEFRGFEVEDHLVRLKNDSVLGILNVSGRYVPMQIHQQNQFLTVETELLAGNEGYYCLGVLQSFFEGISETLVDRIQWNIRKIRYLLPNFGSTLLPAIPKDKNAREGIVQIRKNIILDTTRLIYAALLDLASRDPLRFFLRPESTTAIGAMKFRIMENDPVKWIGYRGEVALDNEDPEGDVYQGGRMDVKIQHVGNVAISSVDPEKSLGVDVRVDVETTLQDLINVLSLIWYAFLTFDRSGNLYTRSIPAGTDILNPTPDTLLRREVYVLLRQATTGMIHRASPFTSIWKNKICNQDIVPYFFNGELNPARKEELTALEASPKMKGYRYDTGVVYNFPTGDMLERLQLKGYTLHGGEPIHFLLPKAEGNPSRGMFLRIRNAPRRLRDAFAGLGNNHAHVFDKTICLASREKDDEEVARETATGYSLDSTKDEIPWGKDAEVDAGFLPSILGGGGSLLRWGVPETGYSSFLATAYGVLSDAKGRKPTLPELYSELKSFIRDLRGADRSKYFLPLWKFFPGSGFTGFIQGVIDPLVEDMNRITTVTETEVSDHSTRFMDNRVFSRAYGIYYGKNIVAMEYIEKNNDSYEPLELDRLCYAYPEEPRYILEDGLATDIFDHLDPARETIVLLRRSYQHLNPQYDLLVRREPNSSYRAGFSTEWISVEIRKLLFEMTFVLQDREVAVENGPRTRMNLEGLLQTNQILLLGQYLDNTGRQTGLRIQLGKYDVNVLHLRPRPMYMTSQLDGSYVKILPHGEANNPYGVKKFLSILREYLPNVKVTHYSTLPLMSSAGVWKKWLCGFYLSGDPLSEVFLPCALYEGIPVNFENLPERSSIYPFHMTGIDSDAGVVISKLYNRQISDGLVALLLSAIRTSMIEHLISGKWTKDTPLEQVVRELVDSEGEPEVVSVRNPIHPDERYQSLLNGLRSHHRLPHGPAGVLGELRDRKREEYSILFSKDNRILLRSLSSTDPRALNNPSEISARLEDQIRILWRFISELMPAMDRFTEGVRKYGGNHPIYRIHALEDHPYYAYHYEGCLFLNGEEMIRNHFAVSKKKHRVHHRLWTHMDTEHGPEFFLERGLGVHRIQRVEIPLAGVGNVPPVGQLSENDFPSLIRQESVFQTKTNTYFELTPV